MSSIQPITEQIMLQDVLAHLKDLMTASGMAVKESNCPNMRALVTTTSGRIAQHQFEVFKYMNENGMYPIENATEAQVKACIQKFSKK